MDDRRTIAAVAEETSLPAANKYATNCTRQVEFDLVNRCLEAARRGNTAVSREEADIYRLSAQLLQTRYPDEARRLDTAAEAYFQVSGHKPRAFQQVVEDGLVNDVPRLRQLMESALAGVNSW